MPCSSCSETYIGLSGRTLQHRLKKHKRALATNEMTCTTRWKAQNMPESTTMILTRNIRVYHQLNLPIMQSIPIRRVPGGHSQTPFTGSRSPGHGTHSPVSGLTTWLAGHKHWSPTRTRSGAQLQHPSPSSRNPCRHSVQPPLFIAKQLEAQISTILSIIQ